MGSNDSTSKNQIYVKIQPIETNGRVDMSGVNPICIGRGSRG